MNTQTRLTRSTNEKVIGGVCGGLASYFGIDPVLVRLLFVVLVVAGGISILLYPILWLIMPAAYTTQPAISGGWQEMRNLGHQVKTQVQGAFAGGSTEARFDPQTGELLPQTNNRNRTLGAVLLGIGVIILANMFPGGSTLFMAAVLLAGGIYLLRRGN